MIDMEEFYQNQQCSMEELAEMLGMCRSSIARQRTGDVMPSAATLAIINNWEVCGPMIIEAIGFRQQLQDKHKTYTERLDRRNATHRSDNAKSEEVYEGRLKAARVAASGCATSPPDLSYLKKKEPSFL